MKKIKWSGVKKVFLEIVGVLVASAVFWGGLFALAEPFMSKGKCVWAEKENANLTQNNENDVVLNGFVCSICGHRESSLYPINAVIGGGYIADEHGNFFYPPKMNYCPHCGAKMDGKGEGE